MGTPPFYGLLARLFAAPFSVLERISEGGRCVEFERTTKTEGEIGTLTEEATANNKQHRFEAISAAVSRTVVDFFESKELR